MSNENESIYPSLKQKLKSSLQWLRHHNHHNHNQQISSVPITPHSTPVSSLKTFKHKCRNLITRIGHDFPNHRHSHSHNYNFVHRRRRSIDFRYNPLSYALNFDNGGEDSQIDEFPNRNFTSRLPRSPSAATLREIMAYT
ncbi:hypothetical protein E1A91_A05G013100v1 [Gossypium mustelinum]|uniref:Uncharacterized protein n=3 Tax=Gossypium TaxID=3633 RepID=A0A5D2Z0X4_GOSMU|nr:hypothetical protein ES288_A05G013200v1 [Gossypium darwinii]TYI24852.1 hypothetical protein ES332_A05G013400v1 [Gossypium tomentosum]TYJ32093.1 hypothetical protein E1A91_A05G013100v1 [Gossypium mustelinum]